MKIAAIDAIHLRIEDPNIRLFDGSSDDCLIVVTTDDGRVGIGEVESFSPAIVALVNGPSSHNHAMCLRDLLVGETLDDPAFDGGTVCGADFLPHVGRRTGSRSRLRDDSRRVPTVACTVALCHQLCGVIGSEPA